MAEEERPAQVAVLDIEPFLTAIAQVEGAAVADVDSFGNDAAAVVERWGAAMRDTGLVVITGHGIEDRTFEALHSTAGQFFDMSNEEKTQSFFIGMSQAMMRGNGGSMDSSGCRWTWKRLNAPKDGWSGGVGTGGGATSDSVELVSFHNDPADIVPAKPSDFREKIDAAYAAGINLSAQLMSLCAAALGLPLDFFKASYTDPDCTLRIAYYPHVKPARSTSGASGALPQQKRLRYGEHVDFTALTIVRADGASGGLEVELPDGSWSAVPKLPGALVVNAGDLLNRWTNGRWKAALHRVACPTEPEHEPEPREQQKTEATPRESETSSAIEETSTAHASSLNSQKASPACDASSNAEGSSKSASNMLTDATSEPEPDSEIGATANAGPIPNASTLVTCTASFAAVGGVDYDALILAAKTEAQRTSYQKMKAKAETRAMRKQIEELYTVHNPTKLPEIPGLIEKYGAESLLAMAQRKYQGTASVDQKESRSVGDMQRESNKRISLVFFTRPCEGTLVECLPGCELDNDNDNTAESGCANALDRAREPGKRLFPPIWAQDYRRVAEETRTALDGGDAKNDSNAAPVDPSAEVQVDRG